MSEEERAEELLSQIFDSVLREKGEKLVLAYLSDILQAVKEIRLLAIDIESHVDSWKEARMTDTEIHAHGLTAEIVGKMEASEGDFAESRRGAAHVLQEGCIEIEKAAVDMMGSCLAVWPPL